MRLLHASFLAFQTIALVQAGAIKWTLHTSCYKNQDGTDNDGMANAMIGAVETTKQWASNGASKLPDAISSNPFTGRDVKKVVKNLLGEGDKLKSNGEIAIGKFKLFQELEGPIGKDGPANAKYEKSQEWKDLGTKDDHHQNFIIVCRPDLTVIDPDAFSIVWTDNARGIKDQSASDLQTMLDQENAGMNWEKVLESKNAPKAITRRMENPENDQKKVPSSVNFHPVWLATLRDDKNWGSWTDETFSIETRGDALSEYLLTGKNARPIDGILAFNLAKTMFHEMFHLTFWGGMLDEIPAENAYGWLKNVEKKNMENPDLYAILAVIIELVDKGFGGKKYTVKDTGAVSGK
ncbi:hypothetical protein ACHAQA_002818 [Verticillium albo-atrum]